MAPSPSFKPSSDLEIHLVRRSPVVLPVSEQRRAILAEIDNAHFSWFHVKVAFVSGAGFFTDAYDIFAINIVAGILGYLYGSVQSPSDPGLTGRTLSTTQELGIKVATPIGILVGQLVFGWLADVLGRKRSADGVELIIMIIATVGQTVSAPGYGISVIGVLITWRAILGIGIGGDYPLSAVISSEFSSVHIRGRVMTAVFANQGWGQLAATLVSYIAVASYKSSIIHDPSALALDLDQIWRIIIGLGCVPAAFALYFRLTIPETPRFTMDVEWNVQQAALDVDSFLTTETYIVDPEAVARRVNPNQSFTPNFRTYFARWEHLKVLIGTSYSWFALDIAFYGLGLNSSVILTAIGFGAPSQRLTGSAALYAALKNTCVGNLVLSVAGFVPGYWLSFLFIDRWGRKPIQLTGFAVLAVLFLTMGSAYARLTATPRGTRAFVFLYCLANIFQNFGPNTTTFIVPGEAFPTRHRATAHGIAAASGKLGAVVAQLAFQWLKNIGGRDAFLGHILQIFAGAMLTGALATLLVPETNQRALEALAHRDGVCPMDAPRARKSPREAACSAWSRFGWPRWATRSRGRGQGRRWTRGAWSARCRRR
ncbi:phosphate transporter [Amylocystis lapponica]|nr:phosphate transporter [Amylocystis lapponica]